MTLRDGLITQANNLRGWLGYVAEPITTIKTQNEVQVDKDSIKNLGLLGLGLIALYFIIKKIFN